VEEVDASLFMLPLSLLVMVLIVDDGDSTAIGGSNDGKLNFRLSALAGATRWVRTGVSSLDFRGLAYAWRRARG
jgi:hypothetical protein